MPGLPQSITVNQGIVTGVAGVVGGRAVAQVAAAAAVVSLTVGGADGSFLVSANVLVLTSVTHSFTCQLSYTDESGTARVLTLTFSQVAGTLVTAITNVTGAGAYQGVPLHIRAQTGSTITLATAGTFTSVSYNVEGFITQLG